MKKKKQNDIGIEFYKPYPEKELNKEYKNVIYPAGEYEW